MAPGAKKRSYAAIGNISGDEGRWHPRTTEWSFCMPGHDLARDSTWFVRSLPGNRATRPAVVILPRLEFCISHIFDVWSVWLWSGGSDTPGRQLLLWRDVTSLSAENSCKRATCRVLWSSLGIWPFLSYSSDSLILMETEGSLPYSQQQANFVLPGPY